MSAAAVQTKCSEAVALSEAGDYAGAISKLLSAKMLLAGMPNAMKEGASLQWDRASIDSLIGQIRQQQAASGSGGGIRRTKITYRNRSCDDA